MSLLPSAGGEKTAATLRGTNSGIVGLDAEPEAVLKTFVVLDGIVDRGSGEQRVEASTSGSGIVLVENGLSDRLLSEGLAGPQGGSASFDL